MNLENTAAKLLDTIDKQHHPDKACWQDWHIERISGGKNNLLYRAYNRDSALVIKFTIPGQRDRAGREYQSLICLQNAGSQIAPSPVLLDRKSYQYPVVVQTWLDGTVSHSPPSDDDEWHRLLEHYVAVHNSISPTVASHLPPAAMSMMDSTSGIEQIERQFSLIPKTERNAALHALLEKVKSAPFPEWDVPAPRLCRCDPNPLNFVRKPKAWLSVDWENSGWGDPAFEIADLMAHPSYKSVEQSRWEWFIEAYADAISDFSASRRIPVYYDLMIVWWVFRLSREQQAPAIRLATQSSNWYDDVSSNLTHYLSLALELR